ncbi:MAG: SH3 domain-containing protein, partial [Lachnospiraceae bacterium]|nr:SH3 domain-containing protein [Lachnospiraceae bacterium]
MSDFDNDFENDLDDDFESDFDSDFGHDDNGKLPYILAGVIAIILLIIVIVVVVKHDSNPDRTTVSGNTETEETQTAEIQPGLVESTNQGVIDLVNNYFNALVSGDTNAIAAIKSNLTDTDRIKYETQAQYIEAFEDIVVYEQPGPVEGSYVTFAYYKIKYVDIDTRAPGLTTIYICTRDDGSLYINSDNWDEATTNYINEIAQQEDVINLFNQVTSDYQDARSADVKLNLFVDQLAEMINTAIENANATAAATEDTTATAAETATPTTETVVVKEKVNVRQSDSTEAEKLGQVEGGTELTRLEVRENGWSKVDYNGQEAFIMSEYLEAKSADAAATETTETAATETTETAATETTSTSSGKKIKVNESVRIRESASTDSEVVGAAYEGETYDLIEE